MAINPVATAHETRGQALKLAWSGWPGRVLRTLLAVLPLVWLSRQVNGRLVLDRAIQVGPRGLALALLAAFGSLVIGVVRWQIMLHAYGADPAKLPKLQTLLRHTMVGQYFSVLPTGVAGEAIRGYRVASCLPTPATSYVILFVDRIAGLLGLLAIAAVAAVFDPVLRGGPVAFAMNVGIALALGFGAIAFVLPQAASRIPWLRTLVLRVPIVGPLLARIPAAQRLWGPVAAVLLSVLSQMCVVLAVAALLGPLSPAATLGVCARIVPALILITFIPLTPGGLGQREAAFVHFFALAHVEPEASLAASLLFFAVMLALSLAGGVVLMYERARGLE